MLIGIAIFVALVLVHELGHFVAAKRSGVIVEEFGIGFPPRLISKRLGSGKNKTKYSINLIPLGGFVRLQGENESDKRKGSFGAASIGAKTKIALAGVAMNALLAVVVFAVLAAVGSPRFYEGQFEIPNQIVATSSRLVVAGVEEDSPAAEIGLKQGTIVTQVAEVTITNENELTAALDANKGKNTEITYIRDKQTLSSSVLLTEGEDEGVLGIVPFEAIEVKHSLLAAPIVGIATAVQFAGLTLQGFAISLWGLLSGNFASAAENVVGPVGIFSIFSSLSELGAQYLIFFGGILSVTLAVINILPLPALDGGRLMMTYITHFFKLRLSAKREELIHIVGFLALLTLAVVITFVDIGRL